MDIRNETYPHPHVSSRDVEGTTVYSLSGEKLGHIEELEIDKQSGRIAFAVLGFGGFLGFGQGRHPIPWGKLRYDLGLDGYVTDLTPAQVEAAPARAEDWYRDREWERASYRYYGLSPYWV